MPTLCPQEEEERKAREEQARREHEEYLKLKEAFVVEEEGVGETMTEEQVGLPLLQNPPCPDQGGPVADPGLATASRAPCCSSPASPVRPREMGGCDGSSPSPAEALSLEEVPPKLSPWEAVLLAGAGGTCRWLGGTEAGTQAGGTQLGRRVGTGHCSPRKGHTHSGFSAPLVPQLPDRVRQLH